MGFILGNRIAHIPYVIRDWRKKHPDADVPDGLTLNQPWPGSANSTRREQVIYQYRADRARRTLRGIDEQVGKAEKAVAGKVPVKRIITVAGGDKTMNRELEAKARTLAGWKSYITNITAPDAHTATASTDTRQCRTPRRARRSTIPDNTFNKSGAAAPSASTSAMWSTTASIGNDEDTGTALLDDQVA